MWLAANTALAACARGQARNYDQGPAAVNPRRINNFALFCQARAGLVGRWVSRPTEWDGLSDAVDGTAHAERTTFEHVRVHHRRADICVPQQLLHRPKVIAVLE
jgi:hypothetical protein